MKKKRRGLLDVALDEIERQQRPPRTRRVIAARDASLYEHKPEFKCCTPGCTAELWSEAAATRHSNNPPYHRRVEQILHSPDLEQ